MSAISEVACAALFACGLILTIVVFESNQWEQSDTGTVFSQASTKNGGLWEMCLNEANSGTETCSTYDSFFLGLPLHLQAARACTISALVCEAAATLLVTFAISFCPCASSDIKIRNHVRLVGAASGAIGGLAIVSGVSWFASTVMQSYYNTMLLAADTERLAFGTAIFIGWAAGAASLLGSLLAACMSCSRPDENTDGKTNAGRKMTYYSSSTAQEYV